MEKKDIFSLRRKPIEFNSDQKNALLKVEEFLHSEDIFFLLAGFSGTGKTTIIENIANYTDSMMLAPTNAAVKRMKEKLGFDKSKFSTIHSYLFTPRKEGNSFIDENGTEQKFDFSSGFEKGVVYIIDEFSMIDRYILNYIHKHALERKCKVIFVGDSFQLAPIGDDPMIFNWEKNSEYEFKEKNKFELTEVQRYDGFLLKAATHIRQSRLTEVVHFKNNELNIVNSFNKKLKDDIITNNDYVVLTATNERRIKYNKRIRKVKFNDTKELLEIGEKLICVNNNSVFCNSDIFYVGEVSHIGTFKFVNNQTWYDAHIIRHNKITTVFIPELIEPSLHGATLANQYNKKLISIDRLLADILFKYQKYKHEYSFRSDIVIATYGYATSTYKAQSNEWDNVYIDPEGLFFSANKARWFYTAITRAKKYVQIVHSKHLKLIEYVEE